MKCQENVTDSPVQSIRSIEDHRVIDQDYHAEKLQESLHDGPYWTEGIHNPGWLTVLGTWITYFVCAGTTSSWGVFQAEYNKMYSNEIVVSVIGSTAAAVSMLGILATSLIYRIGIRYTMLLGASVSTVALILACFSTELWQLFMTQGFIFGLGLCLVFSSPATLVSQWFVKRRALVNAIAWSGATIGPMISANGFQALLTTFGRQLTLAIMAGAVFVLLLVAVILSRPRYSVIHSTNNTPNNMTKYDDEHPSEKSLLNTRFILTLFLSFAYPFHWQTIAFLAPSYAQHVGASSALAASTIIILFATTTISRIVFGYIADRFGRMNVLMITLSMNAIFIMAFWRYANTFPMFAVFCGLLGIFGGHWPNMRPVIISDLVGMKKAQKAVCVTYAFAVPGCLAGNPFISYIHSRYGWTVAIQIIGVFGAFSTLAALAVRFMTNKQVLAIV